MAINPRIIDILALYEDLATLGQTPTVGELCRDCPELAGEVHRRIQGLKAFPSPHGLTESPARGLAENGEPWPASAIPNGDSVEPHVGNRIGPYELVQKIGEGGMGSVWMAEQTKPVRRTVALKLIKPGNNDQQYLIRFAAERQALALMDHPNIAKVLDAGTIGEVRSLVSGVRGREPEANDQNLDSGHRTPDARPFLVMELINGIPITKFCDHHKLTVRQRLELFIQVCHAIQHAHQKGIIHRDIKPSNVLVAIYDGVPIPKVIDFGVAKATGFKLTEDSQVTRFGTVIGTLEYMSPEQTDANSPDIDTRSDIYSLGVLLYELLTSTTPVTSEQMAKEALYDIVRSIRETEPPPPSSRLSHSGPKLASIAAQRDTDSSRLAKMVRGELDWLVMKALEKDRDRRYETANAFALDVQRYLNDEPILARPPSATYRLRKFAKRHKGGLAVAAAVAVAVLVAVGSVGWMALDRRTRLAVTARQVTESLQEVESLYRKGKLPEAVLAARAAQAQLQSGGGSDDLQVSVQDWLADLDMVDKLEEIRFRWANRDPGYAADFHKSFRDYGIDPLTLPVAESAVRIEGKPIRVDLAAALDFWAMVGIDPKFDPGLRSKLLDIARVADPDPVRNRLRDLPNGSPELQELARSIDIDSQPLATLELLSALLTKGESRLAFLRRLHRRLPDNFRVNVTLAIESTAAKRHSDAVRFNTAAVALRPKSSLAHMNLGTTLGDQGSKDEAILSLRTAIELDPNYAKAHHNLAWVLFEKGLLDDAIAANREAIRLKPGNAGSHLNLGVALDTKGLIDEAIGAYREAIRLAPQDAVGHYDLGQALRKKAKTEESFLDEAIDCLREALRLNPGYHKAHFNLGWALDKKGALDGAASAYREAHELRRKVLGADHTETLIALDRRIKIHLAQDNQVLVEPLLRERLKMYEQKEPNSWKRYDCMSKLGGSLAVQRKFEEAEPLLLGGYEGMKLQPMAQGPQIAAAVQRLVKFYGATDNAAEAERWRKELEGLKK